MNMEFENGIPRRKIDEEIRFSVFAAINYLSKLTNIKTEKLLTTIEFVNRIITSLILNIILSSVTIISKYLINNKIISSIMILLISYVIAYLIEILTKLLYKPKYYDRTTMKLSDVIDKVSGPNKDWDIIDPEESRLRKEIEYRIFSIFSTMIVVFLLSIITSILIDYGNPLEARIDSYLFSNGISALISYFVALFFFNHFSFSLKEKGVDKIIYGFLFLSVCTILFYFLSFSYYYLYFKI